MNKINWPFVVYSFCLLFFGFLLGALFGESASTKVCNWRHYLCEPTESQHDAR